VFVVPKHIEHRSVPPLRRAPSTQARSIPARSYLFDTGSGLFNALYTSPAAFGGLSGNMANQGLPTGIFYNYGDNPSGSPNEYDSNAIYVPSLTFYATPTSTSGVTLNATTPSGASSNFIVNMPASTLPAMTWTPYAAVQPQTFHSQAFSKTDVLAGGLALNYQANDTVDTRTESARALRRLCLFSTAWPWIFRVAPPGRMISSARRRSA
jgi:hypothetical protein